MEEGVVVDWTRLGACGSKAEAFKLGIAQSPVKIWGNNHQLSDALAWLMLSAINLNSSAPVPLRKIQSAFLKQRTPAPPFLNTGIVVIICMRCSNCQPDGILCNCSETQPFMYVHQNQESSSDNKITHRKFGIKQ